MLYIVLVVIVTTLTLVLADNLTVTPKERVVIEGAPLPPQGAGAWARPASPPGAGAQRRSNVDLVATLRKQLMRNNYDYQNAVIDDTTRNAPRQRFLIKENKVIGDGNTDRIRNGLTDDIAMIKNELERGLTASHGQASYERHKSRERPVIREQPTSREQPPSAEQSASHEDAEKSGPQDELYVKQPDTGQEDESKLPYEPTYLRYDPDPSETFYAHYALDRTYKTTRRHHDKRHKHNQDARYARARSMSGSKESVLSQEEGRMTPRSRDPSTTTTRRRLEQPINKKDLLYYVDDANLRRQNRVSADMTFSALDDDEGNSTQHASLWDGRRAHSGIEQSDEAHLSHSFSDSKEIHDELPESNNGSTLFENLLAVTPTITNNRHINDALRRRSSTPGDKAGDIAHSDVTTDTTPAVTYKLLTGPGMRRRAGRRHNSGRHVLEERRADGVALVSLGGGAPPRVRLPAARRQYMKERHDPRPPLADVHLTRHRHRDELYATDLPSTT